MLFEDMPPLKVFPKGTPVREIDIVDRGQKMVFTCSKHPGTALYASKNPSHSNWFLAGPAGELRECPCQFSDPVWVLAHDYAPKRND